jgi:hypothetical protein
MRPIPCMLNSSNENDRASRQNPDLQMAISPFVKRLCKKATQNQSIVEILFVAPSTTPSASKSTLSTSTKSPVDDSSLCAFNFCSDFLSQSRNGEFDAQIAAFVQLSVCDSILFYLHIALATRASVCPHVALYPYQRACAVRT